MMEDVDGLSQHIDPLIHRYLVQAYTIRAADTAQRPFAYFHDTFTYFSNPRRVVASDTTVVTRSSSTPPLLPIVHHSSINLFRYQFYNQFLLSDITHQFFITLFYLKIFFDCLLTL